MLTRTDIYSRALPIVLANASVPLLGLADTTMLGRFGSIQDLAALAICSVLFNIIFWSLGFLRMSTTGLIAQSSDPDQSNKRQLIVFRSILLALLLSLLLLLLRTPIKSLSFFVFQADLHVESIAQEYFDIRIWGAPATLIFYCICGICIGLGKSTWLMLFQLLLNLLNIALNFLFVYHYDLGIKGLAWGTLISEYLSVFLALLLTHHFLTPLSLVSLARKNLARVFDTAQIYDMVVINRDIFIRTLFILLSFFWFTNQSAQLGDVILAANQILLTLISFSAFFLDGFAFVAEAEVGRHYSRRDRLRFTRAVRLTTEAAAITALALSVCVFHLGAYLISAITNLQDVRNEAINLAPFAAAYILLSFPAFQLDGIFIGTTSARQLRNASIFSFILFIASYYLLTYIDPLQGLWLSFIFYVIFRAGFLGYYYKLLLNTISNN